MLAFYGCGSDESSPNCDEDGLNKMLHEEYGLDLSAPGFGGRKIQLGETVGLDDLGPMIGECRPETNTTQRKGRSF
jgi:hypothetical protein